MIEVLSFKTNFQPNGIKSSQSGLSHTRSSDSQVFNLSLWTSDFIKNIFEKETHERDTNNSLLKRGSREGQNELGEHWTETWNVAPDGSQ